MLRRWASTWIAVGLLVGIAGAAIGAEPAPDNGVGSPEGMSGKDPSTDNTLPAHLSPAVGKGGEQEVANDNGAGITEGEPSPDAGVEGRPPPATVADPIEPFNRAIFTFNDKAYYWFFKPVAKGYNLVVPQGVRVAVRNFFSNLATPVRVANNLLQGKFRATGTELLRFTINSTIGMAGLFDPAHDGFRLGRKDADLGQTLGRYGLGQGMYLVLPFLGPMTLRDGTGRAGDLFLDPVSYITPTEASVGVNAYKRENDLSLRIGEYEDLTGSALDPYVAVRDAYAQHRAEKVREK
ncbi:MAG: MlaA family lipoprotein [Desulfobacteria bacterium]